MSGKLIFRTTSSQLLLFALIFFCNSFHYSLSPLASLCPFAFFETACIKPDTSQATASFLSEEAMWGREISKMTLKMYM